MRVNDSQIFGCVLAALGIWIVSASRGAYAWYANKKWTGTNTAEAWFAMLLGPRLMSTIYFLLGLGCIVSGIVYALGLV